MTPPFDDNEFLAATGRLIADKKVDEALALCVAAEREHPDQIFPPLQAGVCSWNIQGDAPGAIAAFTRALQLEPHNAFAHSSLATIYWSQWNIAASQTHARAAVPHSTPVQQVQLLCRIVNDFRGGLDIATHALGNSPNDPELLRWAGNCAYALGEFVYAECLFEQALYLRPDSTMCLNALADIQRLSGHHDAGWRTVCRLDSLTFFAQHHPTIDSVPSKRWRGQDPRDKRILVQNLGSGLGDNIMMARYVRALADLGARVIYACQPALLALYADLPGAERVVDHWCFGEPDSFDYWIFDYQLPRWMGAAEGRIPTFSQGYLACAPEVVDAWAPPFAPFNGQLKVGLCWFGNPSVNWGNSRFPPAELVELLPRNSNIAYLLANKHQANSTFSNYTWISDLSGQFNDFSALAGFMANCDVIVSVDSAPLHLAAALGRPVFALIPSAPEWRWGLNGDTAPWYPNVKLFRQPEPGDWTSVIRAVGEAITALAG